MSPTFYGKPEGELCVTRYLRALLLSTRMWSDSHSRSHCCPLFEACFPGWIKSRSLCSRFQIKTMLEPQARFPILAPLSYPHILRTIQGSLNMPTLFLDRTGVSPKNPPFLSFVSLQVISLLINSDSFLLFIYI